MVKFITEGWKLLVFLPKHPDFFLTSYAVFLTSYDCPILHNL